MAEAARYHAIRKIADGGSAEVFLAMQQGAAGFSRHVVLKRIRPALWADEKFRSMLIDEARLAMSLRHPNLVEVLDVGESAGRYFLVLELVDGWTLHQLLRRAREAGLGLPPELAVYVAAEVCRGLAYAHERKKDGAPLGVVHRDICPNNVLVSMHAEVKIADFGIAQAETSTVETGAGLIKGKPAYMSPEQARGEPLDARSDLFSVGTVLFRLLTDAHPFPGPSDYELLRQISETDAPPLKKLRPDLPDELAQVLGRALARDRAARFQSAQELLGALEQVQRAVLKPAGRSELDNWLRTLSARDGETAITRQTMPPAPVHDEPEWISLSAEQAVVTDQTATQQGLPAFVAAPPPSPSRPGSRWVVFVLATVITAAVGWWLQRAAPAVAPAAVDAGVVLAVVQPPPVPAPAAVEDAGEVDARAAAGERADAGEEVPAVAAAPVVTAEPIDAGAVAEAEPPKGEESAVGGGVSRSGTPALKLSARLVPNQRPGKMVGVAFDSEPQGVAIKVEGRELGRTPTVLHFKGGFTFDVWFEAEGQRPLRQWLMLTEKDGKPRVTLRHPVE